MASQAKELHFLVFPLMGQGHMIPMVDIARLLAQRGVIITIVTTPHNAARFESVLTRDRETGLRIHLLRVKFPYEEAGLPEGCENFDLLPSLGLAPKLFSAASMLQKPAEKLIEELTPQPNCVISDVALPWTIKIARKYNIPRITFHGTSGFFLFCLHKLVVSKTLDNVRSETEFCVVPDLPDRIVVMKAQLQGPRTSNLKELNVQIAEAETGSYGVIINSFEELEPTYVKDYKKARKAWFIGPASSCNKDDLDKAQRGNKSSVNEHRCLKWLDSWKPSSVVYACLGSICNLTPSQLIELGLGLDGSKKPFIWVIRGTSRSEELEKWFEEDGFEERTKERGMVIRGWAPQVLILSHPAVGVFLTHCGWNSTLEGVCAGVPMVTWPLFADQFLNEKLVAQVLNIAITLGSEDPLIWGEEEDVGVKVKRETIKNALEKVLDEGEESKDRMERAKKLGELAKRAVEEGGSSHVNMTLFIEEIVQFESSQQKE
ncbi:UDP-glucuronosyl/UDP-glucosyltransferase [Parasponia andersonii]|uniref:Glycosyltransferase n=1 Tax=Parasponia andersonii TaxID=3476 RepID=A0A2P5A5G4_PARAD|nr:UDP-glucuronosyl/UDP-glucosyltransferase [Parasponia andersonii]